MTTSTTPRLFARTWNPAASPSAPLGWRKPGRVLVEGDLFGEGVDDSGILAAFDLMRRCTWAGGANCGRIGRGGIGHTFVVPTEHTVRMAEVCARLRWTGEELVLGTGGHDFLKLNRDIIPAALVHDQPSADTRIPYLLRVPARLRAVWVRGMRGAVDLYEYLYDSHPHREHWPHEKRNNLHWAIASGGDDPVHPQWVRDLAKQCRDACVPFAFLGWGEWAPIGPGSGLTLEQDNGPRHWFKDEGGVIVTRVGRSRSGRMLDGVEHLGVLDGLENRQEVGNG